MRLVELLIPKIPNQPQAWLRSVCKDQNIVPPEIEDIFTGDPIMIESPDVTLRIHVGEWFEGWNADD